MPTRYPPVSSREFAAVLIPAAPLRKLLLGFSACATLAGIVLIAGMPLRPSLKAITGLLWLCRGYSEMASLVRGQSRASRLRFSSGGAVHALSPGRRARSLRVLSGSVVLSRVGWLRLCFGDGLRYGELIAGNPRRNDDWRRLQVLWRQQGAGFGGSRRS